MQHCIVEVLDGAGLFGTLTVTKTGGWDGTFAVWDLPLDALDGS